MKKKNLLIEKKNIKKGMRGLKNFKLNWLLEADYIEIIPINREEFKIIFVWKGFELFGYNYDPSKDEYILKIKKGIFEIQKIKDAISKLWFFDKRGALLWESPFFKSNIKR